MSAELLIRLTHRQPSHTNTQVSFTLTLTAEERTRSRYRFETLEGKAVFLRLPRGTILQDGDILADETNSIGVKIIAKPEPVLTVTGKTSLDLLRGAYHLGNRHVPLEITPSYLRLAPDSVLRSMLLQLGLEITEEIVPFHPELGAYRHHE